MQFPLFCFYFDKEKHWTWVDAVVKAHQNVDSHLIPLTSLFDPSDVKKFNPRLYLILNLFCYK